MHFGFLDSNSKLVISAIHWAKDPAIEKPEHPEQGARPGALDDVGNQEEEAVREEKSASNSSRFVLQQSCYLKWSLSLLVSCCTFNVLEAVYFSSKVQCKLRQSDGDVILEDPQELLFHLPEGLTSQTHNLYWMLECLDFN